jgi:hypothetical protein
MTIADRFRQLMHVLSLGSPVRDDEVGNGGWDCSPVRSTGCACSSLRLRVAPMLRGSSAILLTVMESYGVLQRASETGASQSGPPCFSSALAQLGLRSLATRFHTSNPL